MPNPWDLQPRTVPPEGTLLDCPVCGRPTDSLKRYRYVDWLLFFVAFAVWWESERTACPRCVRSWVAGRCLRNLVPAHLGWPITVLPWGLYLYFSTYRRGHQLADPYPKPQTADEYRDLDWNRVAALSALGVSWVPCFGLVAAPVAFVLSRRVVGWGRYAGPAAVVLAAAVHLLLCGVSAFGPGR